MQQPGIATTPNSGRARKGVAPRISAKNSTFATVLVGPKLDKYTVHEELLVLHSEFFRKALRGSFEEARNKTVKLEAEKSHVFEAFVHWLYYQRFPSKHDAKELSEIWTDDEKGAEILTENLIYLYIFCDKFQVPELKMKTITELFHFMEDPTICLPSGDMVCFAYANLPAKSPLLQFLVDVFCLWAKWDMWKDYDELEWPPSFIREVLTLYSEYANRTRCRDDFTRPCDYHGHQTPEERTLCEREQEKEEAKWNEFFGNDVPAIESSDRLQSNHTWLMN